MSGDGVAFTVGQLIRLRMGENTPTTFEVTRLEEHRFHARAWTPAGAGRKWAFNRIAHNARVVVDDSIVCAIVGGSGPNIRLKPVGVLAPEEEPAEEVSP